jgi:hypothetical protein
MVHSVCSQNDDAAVHCRDDKVELACERRKKQVIQTQHKDPPKRREAKLPTVSIHIVDEDLAKGVLADVVPDRAI